MGKQKGIEHDNFLLKARNKRKKNFLLSSMLKKILKRGYVKITIF